MVRGVVFALAVAMSNVALGQYLEVTSPFLFPTSYTYDDLSEYLLDPGSDLARTSTPADTVVNEQGTPNLHPLQPELGIFTNGNSAQGQLLPTNNPGNNLTYAGGIGPETGVVLSTGYAANVYTNITDDRGDGIHGPNNGNETAAGHEGEVSREGYALIDTDFDNAVFDGDMLTNDDLEHSGDPTVLRFEINLQSPGFLRIQYVFASDEYPAYIKREFNDSFAILVKKEAQSLEYENIAMLRKHMQGASVHPLMPFSLQGAAECGPVMFLQNQVPLLSRKPHVARG